MIQDQNLCRNVGQPAQVNTLKGVQFHVYEDLAEDVVHL